jgi:hypothetical protein
MYLQTCQMHKEYYITLSDKVISERWIENAVERSYHGLIHYSL